MSNTGGMPAHRFSRRKLLMGGVAALGMAGVGMAGRALSQKASNTSLEPTLSSLSEALFLKGNTLYTYRRHASAVFSVGWSPDGTSIASGSTDTTVQVWQAS
jgi:predicted lipoprotein with Yx(FWY)xxD motif